MSKPKHKVKQNHGYHRQEVIYRGAVKILGLCASHIYASKPQ
jgi:hypothetical protein